MDIWKEFATPDARQLSARGCEVRLLSTTHLFEYSKVHCKGIFTKCMKNPGVAKYCHKEWRMNVCLSRPKINTTVKLRIAEERTARKRSLTQGVQRSYNAVLAHGGGVPSFLFRKQLLVSSCNIGPATKPVRKLLEIEFLSAFTNIEV